MLSVGRTTVYRLIATGELRSVRIRHARRIPIAALEAFVTLLTDSANALTVPPGGLSDYRPGGEATPPEPSPRLSLDRPRAPRGRTRGAGLACEEGRTVPIRAAAAQMVDQTEGEANP